MKTHWLYYRKTLVTGIRAPENATTRDVIAKALDWHQVAPCCSALFPQHAPFEIRNMIMQSEVRD